jgi:hypothetical protein
MRDGFDDTPRLSAGPLIDDGNRTFDDPRTGGVPNHIVGTSTSP